MYRPAKQTEVTQAQDDKWRLWNRLILNNCEPEKKVKGVIVFQRSHEVAQEVLYLTIFFASSSWVYKHDLQSLVSEEISKNTYN